MLLMYSLFIRNKDLSTSAFGACSNAACDGEDQAKAQRYNGVYLKNIKLQREEVKSKGANIHLLAKSLVSRS
jgi:hypothetical protein